jgi:hypothetical protein
LASSRGTSNGPDWRDVSYTLDALEEQWGRTVEILIYHSGTPRKPELQLVARLLDMSDPNTGVRHWVSHRRSLRGGDDGDMPAVLLVLLYGLDYVATKKAEAELPETA